MEGKVRVILGAGGGARSARGGRSGRPPGSFRVPRLRNTQGIERPSVKDVLALCTSGGSLDVKVMPA